MTLPNRITARGKLHVELHQALPNVETVSLTMVRCRSWDGAENNAAFSFVVLLEAGAPAANGAIFVTGEGRWRVVLHVQEGAAVNPLSFFLSRTEALHNEHSNPLQGPPPNGGPTRRHT